MLEGNPNIKLPRFVGGPFAGMDTHRTGDRNDLILEKVEELENGNLKLTVQIEGTQQRVSKTIRFLEEKRGLKDALHKWLSGQIGKTIESIYRSEFSFEKGGE